MPDDPHHLTILDAHEFNYDRRLLATQRQQEMEQHLAALIYQGYSGQNVQEVAGLLCEWLAGQFPVRFSVLADEHAARLCEALGLCLLDWHRDLGSAPSAVEYWAGLAPEILKRAVFTLAPECFDLGPGSAAYLARRIMSPERAYVAAELLHHYRDFFAYGLARELTWKFFHERYPREAAEAPLKVESQVCETITALLEGWRESHRGVPMVEDNPLRGITRTARAELKQAHGGNAIVLDEACEQVAIPVVRVFHVALRPQSFWLPPLWCYCVEVDDGER